MRKDTAIFQRSFGALPTTRSILTGEETAVPTNTLPSRTICELLIKWSSSLASYFNPDSGNSDDAGVCTRLIRRRGIKLMRGSRQGTTLMRGGGIVNHLLAIPLHHPVVKNAPYFGIEHITPHLQQLKFFFADALEDGTELFFGRARFQSRQESLGTSNDA